MNEHQQEAISNADAYLNNAALPTYSEAIQALRSAQESLQQLVKINRIPPSSAGLRDATNILDRHDGKPRQNEPTSFQISL